MLLKFYPLCKELMYYKQCWKENKLLREIMGLVVKLFSLQCRVGAGAMTQY